MYRIYKSLVRYVESSGKAGRVDFSFIDVLKDRIEDYPQALALIRGKYGLPYIAINGVIKFYGNIDYEQVYREISNYI